MDEQSVSSSAINNEPQPATLTPEQQAMVNKVVAREKAKAADSARREAEERYQQELMALNAQRGAPGQQQPQEQQAAANMPRELNADAIYQQVQERFNREMQERQIKSEMERTANNYLQKMSQAKTGYDDFDDVTKVFDPTSFPQVTYLVAGMENGGDIVYELAKNPSKLAIIDRLAEKNPQLAQSELAKLSKSISENKQAQSDAQNQTIAAPLDRLQPSRTAGSNGKMSIRDLRSQPHLRG